MNNDINVNRDYYLIFYRACSIVGDKKKTTRGNNVNIQLSGAQTRHRKVFPEERTHTYMVDQLTAPILTHTSEPTVREHK